MRFPLALFALLAAHPALAAPTCSTLKAEFRPYLGKPYPLAVKKATALCGESWNDPHPDKHETRPIFAYGFTCEFPGFVYGRSLVYGLEIHVSGKTKLVSKIKCS